MKFYITGDTHSEVSKRINTLISYSECVPEETALIVLGDLGLNYYLDRSDWKRKRKVESYGIYIYAVRGNHEARPGEKLGMHLVNDPNVGGVVWVEDEFPHIRYFTDWGVYNINGLRTLVIGGAYSVDKWYRLQNDWQWFPDEQLTDFEMDACYRNTKDRKFDLVLAHTCPKSWQPTDLFLNCINQSTVDDTMEVWMDKLMSKINWGIFLFGHYHADRIELPHVEMFYWAIDSLDEVLNRWKKYDETGELDWWLPLSPKMAKLKESEEKEK